ncbi:MAG: dephospho-CoA kinase [Planctomycetota bacterium]
MPAPHVIPVIGVVGGIGSGKSFFAQTLAKRKNLVIVNADAVGHALLERPEIRDRIQERFGDGVIAADGKISRRALGQVVFGQSLEHAAAKADLEAIVHPPLAAELHRQILEAQAAGQAEAIILDAAILLEAGWRKFCDALVMIDAPPELRWQRVQMTRGWSHSEFEAREASQLSISEKRAAADYIVRNVGSEDEVAQQCLQVLNKIMDETR